MLFMRKIRQTILQNFKFGFKLRFKFCFKLCFREKSNTCSNYRNCEFKLCAGKPVDFGFLNYCNQRNQVIVVRYSEDDIFSHKYNVFNIWVHIQHSFPETSHQTNHFCWRCKTFETDWLQSLEYPTGWIYFNIKSQIAFEIFGAFLFSSVQV